MVNHQEYDSLTARQHSSTSFNFIHALSITYTPFTLKFYIKI